MPTVEETITIDRPPHQVWDYVTRTENWPAYDNHLIHAEQLTADPVGIGSRWKGETNVLGRSLDWTIEMVRYDEPHRMQLASIEGKNSFTYLYTLAPANGTSHGAPSGTVLSCRVAADVGLGGAFGKLTDPFVARVYARNIRGNLATLKDLLELHP